MRRVEHLRESQFATGQAAYVTEQEDKKLAEIDLVTKADITKAKLPVAEAGVKLGRILPGQECILPSVEGASVRRTGVGAAVVARIAAASAVGAEAAGRPIADAARAGRERGGEGGDEQRKDPEMAASHCSSVVPATWSVSGAKVGPGHTPSFPGAWDVQ